MKKIYIQPQIKAHAVKANTILAGSMEVRSGSTSEQNAKEGNLFFGFDNDNEEDNY